eukprot:COSAG01_NODE_78173_length_150_cov_109.431373_1_plen_39_part_10
MRRFVGNWLLGVMPNGKNRPYPAQQPLSAPILAYGLCAR